MQQQAISDAQFTALGKGKFVVKGLLDFVSVPFLLRTSQPLFQGHQQWHIDLGEVTHANSAGMALLLEWCAMAKKDGSTVQFTQIPDSIEKIAIACQVDHLLKAH